LIGQSESFEHLRHFIVFFQGFLAKKMFLCTRETSRKPNAVPNPFEQCRGAADVLT